MKKFIIIPAILLSLAAQTRAQDLSNSIEYSQLYIVGPATSAGWSDTNAPEMTKVADGLFQWSGHLEGQEEFKFINTRSWFKNILAASPDITVAEGRAYDLDFYAAWDLGGKDWKFRMADSGDYLVTVDLRRMKMTVTEKAPATKYPSKFYATGSALDNKVIELANFHDAEFKAVLPCKPGSIVVMDTPSPQESTRFYGPMFEAVDISWGAECNAALAEVSGPEAGWSVTVPGDYTIYIDRSTHRVQGRLFSPRKVLYIVGGCCELNWNYWDESNKRFLPNPENPEELVWEGILRKGSAEEPDKFKILTAESWTRETYHPYIEDLEAEGESDVRISGGGDLKWTIKRDGRYRLTLNTRTEKLKGEYLDAPASPAPEITAGCETPSAATPCRVYTVGKEIYVDSPDCTDVTVTALSGVTVATATGHLSGAVCGPLDKGIYLVTTGGRTYKVMI